MWGQNLPCCLGLSVLNPANKLGEALAECEGIPEKNDDCNIESRAHESRGLSLGIVSEAEVTAVLTVGAKNNKI